MTEGSKGVPPLAPRRSERGEAVRRPSQWTMEEGQGSVMLSSPRLHRPRDRSAEEPPPSRRHRHSNNGSTRGASFDAVREKEKETPNAPDGSANTSNSYEAQVPPNNPLCICVLYGLIHSAIVLPVVMSFGPIIYQDAVFRPYLPVLVKLTVFSGVVHQVCFSAFSSLPFAVGQVQDAGLIFLSTMASSVVRYCQTHGHDQLPQILATVCVGLSLATFLLGISLIGIGKLRLASYVQYLPTPVVGGYLAFIGFFCGQSGLALMANVDHVSGILDWYKFFHRWNVTKFVLPGILGGTLTYVLVRKLRHMAVLPTCIFTLLLIFYAVVFLGEGSSLKQVREEGWINQMESPPVWYKTWGFFKFDKVVWAAFPGQILTLFSMIVVVALSSSLDVAAIELELGRPLDYNYELRMIGISNVISGGTGGYTGSYIFSQSIFSLRAGIRSRSAGYVLAFCEFLTVLSPWNVLSVIPNFFFGSLLLMICIDLLYEWLWEVRTKVTRAEHCVALCTFGLIQVLGVEYGLLAGVLIYFILLKLGFHVGGTQTHNLDKNQQQQQQQQQQQPLECSNLITASENGFPISICTEYGGIQTEPMVIPVGHDEEGGSNVEKKFNGCGTNSRRDTRDESLSLLLL